VPADKPTDKVELSDLRREIDAIDDALHDLLMRRVTLTGRVAASKPSDGVALRPAREAEILRRLVGRHEGRFPKAVVARIWREIISANTALQGPFAIAVVASRAADAEIDDALVGVARAHTAQTARKSPARPARAPSRTGHGRNRPPPRYGDR